MRFEGINFMFKIVEDKGTDGRLDKVVDEKENSDQEDYSDRKRSVNRK